MRLAPSIPIQTNIQSFPLREANSALAALRAGQIQGAAVLDC
jgi:propanol-preferring alcohol dehydrogenase